MFFEQLKGLEEISQAVGNRSDYVQGGGGNTSLKLDDRYMAVKASGYKISDVTAENGFVVVNYNNIKQYHENVNLSEDRDYEKESSDYVRANIVQIEGLKALRPSVEAGFHSLLQKYVIHTHPVYTNLLCCSNKGHKIAETIFNDAGHGFVWIPYISPGFMLTIAMREIKQYIEIQQLSISLFWKTTVWLLLPKQYRCIKLRIRLDTIRQYLLMKYPPVGIMPREDGTYIK